MSSPTASLDNPPIQKSISCLHFFSLFTSRDNFVTPKRVVKVGFLERDFERDHLAEKNNWTKMGQKIHCALLGLHKPF
jgi:hypothetical protein